ncbi:MLP-like protein 28 [Senna tora]|uniref:MLP-like protein 28 n=1 Tax=Senna tora TaxID=362788 RepID=A0A835CGJ0_9FABA|nr:MLP-like protein 28 [Senna tora]
MEGKDLPLPCVPIDTETGQKERTDPFEELNQGNDNQIEVASELEENENHEDQTELPRPTKETRNRRPPAWLKDYVYVVKTSELKETGNPRINISDSYMAFMSKIMKLETKVHLNASAEQFHDVFGSRTHHIANACPERVQGVDIHEGEWGTEGSIICWNYVHDGKKCVAKELIESIDSENNTITFKVIEGDLLEHYKSFKFILHVIPQEKGSTAHWILEYEKLKDHIPDPHTLLELVNEINKDLDAHLTQPQVSRVEVDVHLKASAKQFHDVFCNRTHHIANVCPEKVQGVDIHEGEWGTEGSIVIWNYVHDGKKCASKELVESIDTENNKITFKVLEGDLLEHYKSFKFILQVIPQDKGSTAHWILEYEKLKDHVPDPHTMLQLTIDLSKDIDAHLITQAA